MEAVTRDGSALEFASAALRGDKEVVLAALRQDRTALVYAREELWGNREVKLAQS